MCICLVLSEVYEEEEKSDRTSSRQRVTKCNKPWKVRPCFASRSYWGPIQLTLQQLTQERSRSQGQTRPSAFIQGCDCWPKTSPCLKMLLGFILDLGFPRTEWNKLCGLWMSGPTVRKISNADLVPNVWSRLRKCQPLFTQGGKTPALNWWFWVKATSHSSFVKRNVYL